MYCSKCGAKLEEGTSVCPECGFSVAPAVEPVEKISPAETQTKSASAFSDKLKSDPVAAVGLVFSVIAFLFGFIVTTTALALKRGIAYVEYIAIVPALVGLGIGVYKLFDAKGSKTLSYASILLSGFVLFYAFVGFMVFIAG